MTKQKHNLEFILSGVIILTWQTGMI